ncbi:hypothetical protein H8N03_22745 [Ramlibacter sp. USB13]|uniref:Uncharacterized protein n=1 Tax=Ramlibacter cellulosilyticus TaxID=2764187 RepID=A0A923MVG2_9BURK|nr:hypothetical protein [Ramlibacter cellulosilyticus]MBC5785776.1 hypothetical protein [Ramlibacter cellulosilyticus]
MGGAVAERAAAPAWVRAVAETVDDPRAELQALVWGPRFDRDHAFALLARLPRVEGPWLEAVRTFGDRFDALPPLAQRALREGLLGMADNAACRASC